MKKYLAIAVEQHTKEPLLVHIFAEDSDKAWSMAMRHFVNVYPIKIHLVLDESIQRMESK